MRNYPQVSCHDGNQSGSCYRVAWSFDCFGSHKNFVFVFSWSISSFQFLSLRISSPLWPQLGFSTFQSLQVYMWSRLDSMKTVHHTYLVSQVRGYSGAQAWVQTPSVKSAPHSLRRWPRRKILLGASAASTLQALQLNQRHYITPEVMWSQTKSKCLLK